LPVPPASIARAGGPPPPAPAQREAARALQAAIVKQNFPRLTLGMFAASFSSYPLTFSYVGEAEAPQGKADVIEVKGPPLPVPAGRGPGAVARGDAPPGARGDAPARG